MKCCNFQSKSDLISAQDPFEEIEKTVLELLKIWGRETFVVNRQLYEKDEAVCSALEHAVWVIFYAMKYEFKTIIRIDENK